MTMSEKEKKYLIILGLVVVIAVLYLFMYKPLSTKKTGLKNEVSSLQSQIDNYSITLKSQSFYEEEIGKINQEIQNIDSRLPQALPQELVIQTMDTMSKELELTLPTIGLTQVEQIPLAQVGETGQSTDASQQVAEGSEPVSAESTTVAPTLNGLKTSVTTATTCTYEELKNLLGYTRQLPMEIALDNLSLNMAEDQLAASFTMSLFGLEVPERAQDFIALGEYNAGKENIFKYNGQMPETKDTTIYEELFMIIDPVQSDNSAITMGRTKDRERKTYVYEETNAPSDVNIQFTQEGNHYYVRYQVGENVYPADGSRLTFNPSSAIGIKIESTKRLDEEDKNAANLTITNATDKIVYLYVKNDDKDKPRVNLIRSTGEVRVKD